MYTKNPVKAADVTVNYVDEDGNAIPSVSPQTISGNVGGSYDATTDVYKLTIDGYTLDESKFPTNAKGTLSEQAQTVTYVYTKNKIPNITGIPVMSEFVIFLVDLDKKYSQRLEVFLNFLDNCVRYVRGYAEDLEKNGLSINSTLQKARQLGSMHWINGKSYQLKLEGQ